MTGDLAVKGSGRLVGYRAKAGAEGCGGPAAVAAVGALSNGVLRLEARSRVAVARERRREKAGAGRLPGRLFVGAGGPAKQDSLFFFFPPSLSAINKNGLEPSIQSILVLLQHSSLILPLSSIFIGTMSCWFAKNK